MNDYIRSKFIVSMEENSNQANHFQNLKNYTFGFKIFMLFFCLIIFQSCLVKNAKPDKIQTVTVYTDFLSEKDKIIFKQFKKSEKITVYYKVLPSDSILEIIRLEKYNSLADLILLHGADRLLEGGKMNLFRQIDPSEINSSMDENYFSKNNFWCAISKSPIVIIYNKNLLNEDTIKFYNQINLPKWNGKIALQNGKNTTIQVLGISMLNLTSKKHKNFISNLNKQVQGNPKGDDLTQIKKINAVQAQLAFIELSSLVSANQKKDTVSKKLYRNVSVIFPSQTQKGTFYNITGAGIYKYARNPENAQKLLQYLTSTKAQYAFASGRFEFPVLTDVKADSRLQEFGSFRGRFVANRLGSKVKKKS
jgi:iron(III) transport system substrate-binding protein